MIKYSFFLLLFTFTYLLDGSIIKQYSSTHWISNADDYWGWRSSKLVIVVGIVERSSISIGDDLTHANWKLTFKSHAFNSPLMVSSDWRMSSASTSHWSQSSEWEFVIIHRCRDKSLFSVLLVAIAACRWWNRSRSPWCHGDQACRRRRAYRWSSAVSCSWKLWRARTRRLGSYKPFVFAMLECGGKLHRPPSPAIKLYVKILNIILLISFCSHFEFSTDVW